MFILLLYKKSELAFHFLVTKPNHMLNHMGAGYLAVDLV